MSVPWRVSGVERGGKFQYYIVRCDCGFRGHFYPSDGYFYPPHFSQTKYPECPECKHWVGGDTSMYDRDEEGNIIPEFNPETF